MSNQRKPIYFTSDWHIGHKNCLKFDNRPFKDIDQMKKVLIRNFNSCVPKDGVTFVLGDVGMGSFEGIQDFIKRLNGRKILIMGNHDGTINRMYRLGFDAVLFNASIYIANELVTMSHCPLTGVFREDTSGMRGSTAGENWHKEKQNRRFSLEDSGQFHLHGHLHSNKKESKLGRQWDVGVVGSEYRPIHIKKIESWISKHK